MSNAAPQPPAGPPGPAPDLAAPAPGELPVSAGMTGAPATATEAPAPMPMPPGQ